MSMDQKSHENKYPNQGNCSDCSKEKKCHLHDNGLKLEWVDENDDIPQLDIVLESEKELTTNTSNFNGKNVSHKEDFQTAKSSTSKDISEVSPFKQAVKGFVLKKLSNKKVSSSPILSGITGKIVKKLEDGKDNPTALLVTNAKNELIAVPTDNIKDHLQTCELKSVVANDLVDGVEEASECFEEQQKGAAKIFPVGSQLSMSLPASPAHRLTQKSKSCSFENLEKVQFDIPTLSDSKDDVQDSAVDNIELQDMNNRMDYTFIDPICSKHIDLKGYPSNIYVGKEEEISSKETLFKFFYMIFSLKHIFSLPLSNLFLILSIVVRNSELLSMYLGLVFDSIIVGYICYSYFGILIQASFEKHSTSTAPSSSPGSFSENAATKVGTKKSGGIILKGRVKVLKGEYDHEVKKHPTDTVDICIENSCLKLSYRKKNLDDEPQFCFVYDISDAKIAIVPKTLRKKNIWKKHYPICILLSPVAKSYEDISYPEKLSATDYLSLVSYEDAVIETTKQRALYLFASSNREKQSLFWALYRNLKECDSSSSGQSVIACETYSKINLSSMSYTALLENVDNQNESSSEDSQEEEDKTFIRSEYTLNFSNYMETLFENCRRRSKLARSRSAEDILISKENFSKVSEPTLLKEFVYCDYYPVDWLNIVLGRLFYDFLTKRYWSDEVKSKIQRKLDKIEMPNFIESLRISDVVLGDCLPVVHSVTQPIEDPYGVWLNFDFEYNGTFQMTIETKLKITSQIASTEQLENLHAKQNLNLSDSSDEEGNEKGQVSPKKSKILNRIEKWISHRHFATVAQSKIVKRYVGDLTNMPLTLTVEVSALNGILIVNLPPEPSDRIWYGFQKDPDLTLNVFPKVGKVEINLSAVVQTIQKKLIHEFKKALVMPNMDDLIIPIMYSPTLVR